MSKLSELLSSFQATNPIAKFDKQGQAGASRPYAYASYNAVIDCLKPLAAKGLYWSHQVNGEIAGDGYSLIVSTTIGVGDEFKTSELAMPMPPNIQTMGSHITYAKRYQLVALCGMAADEDDDGASAQAEQTTRPAARGTGKGAAKAEAPPKTTPAPAAPAEGHQETLEKAKAAIKKSPTSRDRQELLALVGVRVKQGKLDQQDYYAFVRELLTYITDADEANTNIRSLIESAQNDKLIDEKIGGQLGSLINMRVQQIEGMAKQGATMKPGA